jgi:hypothetical protein
MSYLFFDIETAALPAAEIEPLLPPFNELDVKLGNLKDPEKIAAKIAECRARHRQDFFDRAALDPMTGRLLAVGFCDEEEKAKVYCYEDERHLLEMVWGVFNSVQGFTYFTGFNIFGFDLPFLVRRSWKHGVPVPFRRLKRSWPECFVDLRETWLLGDWQGRGSLGTICKFLGLGEKSGSGADFAALLAKDRAAALAYLENDLRLTARLGARILPQ